MANKKGKNRSRNNEKESRLPMVDAKTKRLLYGIVFLAAGVIVLLSFFAKAGPVGNILAEVFLYLFGFAKFLIPVALLLLGFVFLARKEADFYLSTILGAAFIVLALLGIFQEVEPGSSGTIGRMIGSLSYLFGFWATLVILIALGISGALLTFEVYILERLKPREGRKLLPMIPPPEEILVPPQVSPSLEPRSEAKPEPTSAQETMSVVQSRIAKGKKAGTWQFPPLDILSQEKSQPEVANLDTNAKIIQRTLANFGIPVEMAGVHIGPTVTQYALRPAQGVKLAKIVALHNDLALALATHPIRIEAPIPGKALVGIEVPNHTKSLVRLRNLLEELSLHGDTPSLTFPLGRDVRGQTVFADLAKMPHLMIAGATGSGKSIFIHALILTFLYRVPPHLLRFLLIDPKRVELSQYEGIPYLLSPVITEGKQAIAALRWAISEMERRYDLLLGAKARDIFSYNQSLGRRDGEEPLPFIVIFIDELADLMVAYGREIETSIVRLSQMARATGIHLVVSTQRPSVEVITGLIKANITSRVAFQVASQVDSRTILDMAGAEKLLGSGDMLFLASDTPKPKRIQAPFVSEGEAREVVGFVRKEGERFIQEEGEGAGLALPETNEGGRVPPFSETDGDYEDELYPEAYEVVVAAKKASASLLQRRLKVGYARAARLLDILEAKGVIGPGHGAKPREVYIQHEGHQ